jgi:sugar phosphate isomerase/epimerase
MGLAPALLAGQGQNQLAHFGIISGVFNDAGEDWQAALRQMAEFGYTELESRQRGPSAPEFLYFLRRIKLRLVACGVDFGKQLKSDWLDQPKALEAKYAVTYWPWFHPLETLTLSQLKEIADRLNRCGEECRRAGLRMAFHNHDRDFRLLEGKPVFDRLLELTDPKLVTVQLDLYWMVKAGMDPLIYFKRYPRRFELFHVKDMGPTPEKGFVAVGAGSIDFARIFAQARLAGVKHYIVELEKEAATTENAKQSAAYLRQLRF